MVNLGARWYLLWSVCVLAVCDQGVETLFDMVRDMSKQGLLYFHPAIIASRGLSHSFATIAINHTTNEHHQQDHTLAQ